jgi:hypothetical protein
MKLFIATGGVERIRKTWSWSIVDPLTDQGIEIFLKGRAKVPQNPKSR